MPYTLPYYLGILTLIPKVNLNLEGPQVHQKLGVKKTAFLVVSAGVSALKWLGIALNNVLMNYWNQSQIIKYVHLYVCTPAYPGGCKGSMRTPWV